jgi:putative phage-type endonuclease
MTIASGSMINHADRDAWLAERMNGIGSSEAAAAIGVNPYETALELYLAKLGLSDPVRETEAMRWGTRLEPVIAEAYSETTGYGFIAEQLFVRSPTHDFMTSTIDRIRDDSRIVEFKCVGYRSAHLWGEPGSDEIPPHYLVQCQHQLICTGTEELDLAALIGGNELRIYHICRDDDIAARIVEREAEFWQRVLRRPGPGPALAPGRGRGRAGAGGRTARRAMGGPRPGDPRERGGAGSCEDGAALPSRRGGVGPAGRRTPADPTRGQRRGEASREESVRIRGFEDS